jgi:aspartyl-tRNA(Asn)/glutamyl-tRNA(Gln) amidotransferase subunit A
MRSPSAFSLVLEVFVGGALCPDWAAACSPNRSLAPNVREDENDRLSHAYCHLSARLRLASLTQSCEPLIMTVREWQQLDPDAAAREVHARVRTLLPPTQQRAVIAWLPAEKRLAQLFSDCPRSADHGLAGVPFFAKDLFDVAGAPTFAGSTFLPEVRPTRDNDAAIIRAAHHAGLVCAGKTHLHEFAYGITGENPHYGDCEHPQFPGRTTGGSSSGSAAAVAAGIVPLAFGSDTGGSIRVPAAFCGLFGFRLSPGDAWIKDAFPLAPSFDTAGWFTASAADMRLTLAALIGLRTTHRPLRGCYLEAPGLDADVALALAESARRFAPRADTATRDELLRGFKRAFECYNTIVAIEAWQVHRAWAEQYRSRYDPVVWDRLNRVHSLSPEQIESAELARSTLRVLWTKFFLTYDFLVMPATPCGALFKSECTAENRARILSLTTPASVGGLPVLTIPVPLPSGLTTGLQLIVNQPQSPAIYAALSRAEEDAVKVAA